MGSREAGEFLYVDLVRGESGRFQHSELAGCGERHRILRPRLAAANSTADPLDAAPDGAVRGVLIALPEGLPYRPHLRLARRALERNLCVWWWWPTESAVEAVDGKRLRLQWLQWLLAQGVAGLRWGPDLWRREKRRTGRLLRALAPAALGRERRSRELWRRPLRALRQLARWTLSSAGREEFGWLAAGFDRCERELAELAADASPVEFSDSGTVGLFERGLPGRGAYLRTDFWAPLRTGGSYTHTCYVARELARASEDLVCFVANRFELLDEFGVRQVEIPAPASQWREADTLRASEACTRALRPALEALEVSYLYERLVPGNWAGARLSRDLGIPYIVEYNGSEIMMNRSFGERALVCEELYLAAEWAAFRQACLISVVSEPIRDDLVHRGVDPDRVVVIPNGVDPEDYAPQPSAQRAALRKELGWDDSHRVIGFSATFGGWHGVDVLAELIPEVCARNDRARFLVIGDGAERPVLDREIQRRGVAGMVFCAGRVPQREGARLLAACDIFVSPHGRHMQGSRFFGSPTKVFEFMAMGGGIVASDLEQIGEVLSPALRLSDLNRETPVRNGERAVLCTPGNVGEFVDALAALVERPDLCEALGANARAAAHRDFSWSRHVEKLRDALRARVRRPRSSAGAPGEETRFPLLAASDADKRESQMQWNRDPCGSQHGDSEPGSLSWYRAVEQHRYTEYAPWMPELMEFDRHANEDLLEIGAGLGTDLAQFARHGARVTDVDLSAGHLELARQNFSLRGLEGRFIHQDAEALPLPDASFDVVYTHGVLHHTPHPAQAIAEIRRVLRPGGRLIAMFYARNSLHYWRRLFLDLGLREGQLRRRSMGEILSDVERGESGARPLVKVYGGRELRALFSEFESVEIAKRQLTPAERPELLRWLPAAALERAFGWNLIVKARVPDSA